MTPPRLTAALPLLGLALLTAVSAPPAQAADSPAATGPVHAVTAVVHRVSQVTGSSGIRREETHDRIHLALSAAVLFGKDSATLTPRAAHQLAEAARGIRDARTRTVAVNGYTDNLGSASHGLKLSQQRAHAVKAALRPHLPSGIHLTSRGYGEAHPAADNRTEEGRRQNRRVTLDYRTTT